MLYPIELRALAGAVRRGIAARAAVEGVGTYSNRARKASRTILPRAHLLAPARAHPNGARKDQVIARVHLCWHGTRHQQGATARGMDRRAAALNREGK